MTQKNAVSFILTLIMTTSPLTANAAINTETAIAAVYSGELVSVEDEADDTTAPETVQETLLKVCEGHGYGEDCAKLLMGIMWTESNNRYNVKGDCVNKQNCKALGYFQIHYKMHKVSAECVTDLACAAEWTLNYMESNSYPKYPMYSVQCHNGCNANNGYTAKVVRHANRLWDEPMLASQPTVTPVQVAVN